MSDQFGKPNPPPPTAQPTPQEKGEKVWMACRADPNCDGTHARKIFSRTGSLEGGTVYRYICEKCGKPFAIPMGATFG